LERFVNLTMNGLSQGSVYAAFALSLVLIWRATRVVNFAQGAMAIAAAFIDYTVMNATGSYWIGLAAAVISGALIGAIVEAGVMRWVSDAAPANAVIVAIGVTLVIQSILAFFYGSDFLGFETPFSTNAILVGNYALPSPFDIYTLIVVLAVVVGLAFLFGRTRVGLRLRASAFAPEVSRLLGVSVRRMRTLGWVLAAMVGGLVATVVIPVPKGLGLHPNALDNLFAFAFTSAVLGGLDSPQGAVVGGLLVGLTITYVTGYTPDGADIAQTAILVLLLATLLVRPGGLFSGVAARRV
jgi:branched-chain amino acid transport system permease protein